MSNGRMAVAAVALLAGCGTASEPTPTVTVTRTVAPVQTEWVRIGTTPDMASIDAMCDGSTRIYRFGKGLRTEPSMQVVPNAPECAS